MSVVETGDNYVYFTDEEDKLIQDWLTAHGYTWWQPTLCGSCCGFYDAEYVPNGIGGEMKPEDVETFRLFAADKQIDCTVDDSGRITASEEAYGR